MEESARMKRRTTVPGPVKMYCTRHKHEEPMQTPLGYMYVNIRFVVVCSVMTYAYVLVLVCC